MIDLIILELISLISFLYSIILIFTSIGPVSHMVLIFVYTFVVSLIYALNYRKSKLFEAFYLLIFLPILFYRSIFFFLMVGVLTYLYIKKSLMKGNHYEYVDKLKLTYLLLIFLIVMRQPFHDLPGSVNDGLVFIILYLVSSIVLTRLQRHLDSKMDIRKIRKTNIRYLMTLAIAFILLVFDGLRTSFVNLVDGLIRALYYPLYLLFGKLDFSGDMDLENNIFFSDNNTIEEIPMEEAGEAIIKSQENVLTLVDIFVKVIVFIVIIVIIYLVYKLLMKIGERKDLNSLDYIEEREFIKTNKKRKKRFFRERFPRDPRDQVRYYYRKYLNKVNDLSEIQKADTSLDVNQKATGFDKLVIERIREIYINIRYGNKEIKGETVKEMEELYKKL
ncbi:MAG: hypothetical protein GX300_00425 [Tissierellia bacterium]|nr:hypothetical protein [Tissierellia bacterium]